MYTALIAQQDSVTSGTTMAVQSLDQKNVAGIGDLRRRVTRYAHQAEVYHDVWRLEQEQKMSTADLQTRVKLEARMSGELKEAKEQTDSLRRRTEQQLNSFSPDSYGKQPAAAHANAGHNGTVASLEAESRSAVRLSALEARVEQFEAQRGQTNRRQADQLKRSETKLGKRETSAESSLRHELQLLKQEYHKGFLSVHDAIESLRQISDITSRLDTEKLQKDIRHVCSKLAMTCDIINWRAAPCYCHTYTEAMA
ncbi:LOW QUALITY PROTEIN: protein FAM81B [Lycodopsis pacificus]